jgi:uncharacterized membrane protein YkoI
MKRNLSVQIVVAAFALVGSGSSGLVAAEETEAQLLTQALVSKADAQKTALEKVPEGRVESAELEKENGKLVWSFDIAKPNTRNITEIQVDAKTGQIAAIADETPKDQAEEAKAEKVKKN